MYAVNDDAMRAIKYADGYSRLKTMLQDLKTGPMNGLLNNSMWQLDPKVAAFEKEANQIINDVQMQMKGNGGSTAKMASIIAKSKPSAMMPGGANEYILDLGIAMGERAKQRANFLNAWGQVNTDIHTGELLWERYEAANPAFTIGPG